MKARVCLGIYAANAYYFESLGLEVFCMEELAYCLKENAFLLGTEIMSDEMLHFIGTGCRVPELARELYPMVHQKGSLSGFVTKILDYVGFFDQDEVTQVEDTVRISSGLTDYEKRKLQIDSLLAKKKYSVAIEEYNGMILEMEEQGRKDPKLGAFLGDLYYNRGVVYAHMLLYRQAAESFRESYEWKDDKEVIKSYFFAKRMELSDRAYVAMATKHPDQYELSMQVENKIQDLEQKWFESPECAGLENLRNWRLSGERHKYYEECNQILETMQEDYRNGT